MRESDLQKIYNEWRKTVTIEGMPFTWLGKEENIEAFSKFAKLNKPVEFGQMLDLEGNYDSEECNMFEVKKIYKTKEDYNLEDGSFIKSGTSFFVISKDNYGYNIIFENNDKCYFEHDSRKYYIDELDLELFADSSSRIDRKEFEEKRNLKSNYNNRSATVDNIENRIDKPKEDYTKKEFNSKKSVEKEAQPFYNLDKIKEIPLEDVCNRLGIHTSSKGKKLWCDIRGEKTPSCCINTDKNYWYDFGSSTGGDVIKFISEVEKINAKEAIYRLADMFGIEPENNIENQNKHNFYISNSDYRKIGIEPTRATLNLDINLDKQSIEEVTRLEKAFSKSMNELANSNEDLFLDVLNKKSIPIIYNNIKNYYDCLNRIEDYINEKDNVIDGFHSLETQLYMNYSKELADTLNNQLDILSKTNIDKKIGFELKDNKVDFQKHMNDIFSVCLENGIEVLSQESPEHNKVIKSLDEFKEYIVDYKVPELGDVEVIEEKISKVEKELESYTYIDLISWCDDNDIELVPLRKEKTIEIEKEVTETKIVPKMRM
ncbi:CHC2 zinc finger domain-containing protein [Clostridium perfringens]|uniref:CHC2 zinc finger domain-containing protein n=1 Tax=Clostridium perfringens TaxID=1502 RepID=UPI0024BC4023|nr:CHC2 zinc finger domain-containing protein [Clostridium perfringens]